MVEPALARLVAEFFFDRVLIQPGQPLVFGHAHERFFFGLPGNPGIDDGDLRVVRALRPSISYRARIMRRCR